MMTPSDELNALNVKREKVGPPGTSADASVPSADMGPEPMLAHTPGPWEVKELMGSMSVQARHRCTFGLPNATGYVVLASPAPYGPEYRVEQAATCRLIAAAPDLLEALQRLSRAYVHTLAVGRHRIIESGHSCDDLDTMEVGDPALCAARDAIAKATGQ